MRTGKGAERSSSGDGVTSVAAAPLPFILPCSLSQYYFSFHSSSPSHGRLLPFFHVLPSRSPYLLSSSSFLPSLSPPSSAPTGASSLATFQTHPIVRIHITAHIAVSSSDFPCPEYCLLYPDIFVLELLRLSKKILITIPHLGDINLMVQILGLKHWDIKSVHHWKVHSN